MLADLGYAVLVAETAEQAVAKARRQLVSSRLLRTWLLSALPAGFRSGEARGASRAISPTTAPHILDPTDAETFMS
jgi:hypothetical protein